MKSKVLTLLSLILTIVGFVAPVTQAQANAADVKIQLVAPRDFAGATGAAKYRDRRGEREFQVEVEVSRLLAGAIFTVAVDDVAVGQMRIDTFGKGRLSLNSKLGQVVPVIVPGAKVEIRTETRAIVLAGGF